MPINAQKCSPAREDGSASPKCPTSMVVASSSTAIRSLASSRDARIKARKEDGMNVNLIAACATDIMLSSVQFSLKELDANSVARLFPGIEEMEIRYHRCPSP